MSTHCLLAPCDVLPNSQSRVYEGSPAIWLSETTKPRPLPVSTSDVPGGKLFLIRFFRFLAHDKSCRGLASNGDRASQPEAVPQ